MKKLSFIVLCIVSSLLYAANVEVTADKFFADETKRISVFDGNVKVLKESDKLTAHKVTIDFDAKKQPIRYVATGDAKVNITMNQKRYYGEAEKMTYEPATSVYILEKKAFLHDLETDKKVYGDFIRVEQLNGHYVVDGKNGNPVKFIFKVEDTKK
ncbi:MAG: LptA/OstA family protein [Sulfurospirillaceae bacterium]|nr:LptA/OstA family protein [Sulfurospirillaceae bacterium]